MCHAPIVEIAKVTFAGPLSPADRELCRRFGIDEATDAVAARAWQLCRRDGELILAGPAAAGRMVIDTNPGAGEFGRRLQTARRTDPLPRAVGLHRRLPSVVDATAGLGRDALVLARLGCAVVAIERVAALALLLADSVARMPPPWRVVVHHDEAARFLAALAIDARPDVVYLDPMFQAPGKAQVRKATQALRLLCGPPGNVEQLFAAAVAVARDRVVVKRHRDDPPIAGEPDFAVRGSSVRFDVYLSSRRTPSRGSRRP